MNKTKHEDKIAQALRISGIKFEREYQFSKRRRFRFDFAIIPYKIAIEFEGGIYRNGRHTRGKGYHNDTVKYNLAVMEGWKVLRYTTETTKTKNWEYGVVEDIKELINGQS